MSENILDQTSDRRAANALKSGVYARKLLVTGEQEAAFGGLREELVADWKPRNVTEWLLVDQIARLQWRLLRAEEAECVRLDIVQKRLPGTGRDRDKPLPAEEALAADLIRPDSGLQRMQVFQMRIERAIHRAISQLVSLRKFRRRKMGKLQQQRARKIPAQPDRTPEVIEKERNEIGRIKSEAFFAPRTPSPGFSRAPGPSRPLPALRTVL